MVEKLAAPEPATFPNTFEKPGSNVPNIGNSGADFPRFGNAHATSFLPHRTGPATLWRNVSLFFSLYQR